MQRIIRAAVLSGAFATSMLALGTAAQAQQGTNQVGQPAVSDQQFAAQAARSGMLEVREGRLALQKSQNPAVRKFAQLMIDDHTKANQELMQAAQADGVTLPRRPTRQQIDQVRALAKLSGPAFDRAYMDAQVTAHANAVTSFQTEAQTGQDAQLKAFANSQLGTLNKHLQLAQAIAGPQGDLKGSYPMGTGTTGHGGPPASSSGVNPGSSGVGPGNPSPTPSP